MKPFISFVAVVFLFSNTVYRCQAAIFTQDGTIGTGYNESTEIKNLATVNMTGGNSFGVWIHDYGMLNFLAGSISNVRVENVGTMNLLGSSFEDVELRNLAKFNIGDGLFEGRITAWDSSTTNINGGQVQQGRLMANQYTVTNIYAGNVAWNEFRIGDYAVGNIYGGNISFDGLFSLQSFGVLNIFGGQITHGTSSYIAVNDFATLNIYGGGSAILSNDFYLSDNAKINVYYSSYIRYKPQDPYSPIIAYYLSDGSEFLPNQFTYDELSKINFQYIPEPATLCLLALGGLFLRRKA